MIKLNNLLSVTVYLLVNVAENESIKILGVFHTSAESHYIAGGALMKGLAEKGHNVTVISAFPQDKQLKNFHDVTVPSLVKFHDSKWIGRWKGLLQRGK